MVKLLKVCDNEVYISENNNLVPHNHDIDFQVI